MIISFFVQTPQGVARVSIQRVKESISANLGLRSTLHHHSIPSEI